MLQPADAANIETIPLIGGQTATVGDFKITVAHCQLADGGPSAACSGTLSLTATLSYVEGAQYVTATVEGSTGGPIFDALPGDTGTYDLSLLLSVQTLDGKGAIKSAALDVTGSADVANESKVGVGETVNGSSGHAIGTLNATLASGATPLTFTPQSRILANKDIFDKPAGLTGSDAMILSSVSQTYGLVPEPASVVVLLTGMASLGVLRRRRRRA